jgi:hypothetical protein
LGHLAGGRSFAEHFVEQAPNLEVSGTTARVEVISLREVLVHMIEEYAGHAGHADLTRVRILPVGAGRLDTSPHPA